MTTLELQNQRREIHGGGRDWMAVADDVAGIRTVLVNVFFVGLSGAGDRGWVLIDAGLPFTSGWIMRAAAERFGAGARPSAIILTHGHFDHVGNVKKLARQWEAPVYAHRLEMPYLTGRSAYPPPDPTVGGGLMARSSRLFPRRPIDLGGFIHELPADGTVPGMPGWHWVHTPGHSPGHISLFRRADRVLIAGDAFVTTRQEALSGALFPGNTVQGPPMYFTPDWHSARESVRELASLRPMAAGTGHGLPVFGEKLEHQLSQLASHFGHLAMPQKGRYVHQPAITDETGVVSVPPARFDPVQAMFVAAAAVGAGAVVASLVRRRHH